MSPEERAFALMRKHKTRSPRLRKDIATALRDCAREARAAALEEACELLRARAEFSFDLARQLDDPKIPNVFMSAALAVEGMIEKLRALAGGTKEGSDG